MYRITVQCAAEGVFIPKTAQIRTWAKEALVDRRTSAELTIRIIDEEEMASLNETFRHKKGPTNVLSFPFEDELGQTFKVPPIGDIAICAAIVDKEAQEQNKTPESHWAHMIVHGVLHLLGYDHQEQKEAEIMEHEEIKLLKTFGFNNPYDLGTTP